MKLVTFLQLLMKAFVLRALVTMRAGERTFIYIGWKEDQEEAFFKTLRRVHFIPQAIVLERLTFPDHRLYVVNVILLGFPTRPKTGYQWYQRWPWLTFQKCDVLLPFSDFRFTPREWIEPEKVRPGLAIWKEQGILSSSQWPI